MKKILLSSLVAGSLTLVACNGGGSSMANNPNITTSNPGTVTGDNSGDSGSGQNSASSSGNVIPVTIDSGPSGTSPYNTPFVSVTVCNVNNPSNCQTIDHIILDTGSMGLRIFANKLNSSLGLVNENAGGSATAECTLFGSGYDWGSIAMATVKMGSEVASNIPVQIINDPTIPDVPSDCSSQGAYNDLGGANGIIGVNPLPYDEGSYYSCSGSSCSLNNNLSTAQQVVSPVYMFANDNNGVIVQLPNVPAGGASSLNGTLTFGIGTQSNNQLTAKNIFTSNGSEQDGSFTTSYDNSNYDSIFDTGSTQVFFDTPSNTSALTLCSDGSGLYCPANTTTISAQLMSLGGGNATSLSFNIINFDNYLNANPNTVVVPNSGGQGGGNFFIWGLPFFYGKTIFSAFSGASTSGGTGPYFAF